MTRVGAALLCAVAVAAVPSAAGAQRTTRRPTRQAPIEIRGQVPTPQVVTVRPRAVPAYSREVLVPGFYDHDFWQSILPAYQLVPQRAITGAVAADAAPRADSAVAPRADSVSAPAGAVAPPPAVSSPPEAAVGAPPQDSAAPPPAGTPAPATPADTAPAPIAPVSPPARSLH